MKKALAASLLLIAGCVGQVAGNIAAPSPGTASTTPAASAQASAAPMAISSPTAQPADGPTPAPSASASPSPSPNPTPTPVSYMGTTPTPTPTPTAGAALAPAPTPEPAQAPLSFSGTGALAQSTTFTLVKGVRKFRGTYTGADNMTIYLKWVTPDPDNGQTTATALLSTGSVVSGRDQTITKTGAYYLDVRATGAWTLTVE